MTVLDPASCPTPQKRAHLNRAAAAAHANSYRARWGDKKMRPYQCVCGYWHIGHNRLRPFQSKWEARR